jgi:hypothetical protein
VTESPGTEQASASYAADSDIVVCYIGTKPTDLHLLSAVHCIDGEIIEWLERREVKAKRLDRQSRKIGKPKAEWIIVRRLILR